MCHEVEILEQCGQTREQTCIQRIQEPRGIRGGCTSTIVMLCGSPGRCGRRTAQGSHTAPIAPISSTGTTQPLTIQHCHRARPIRNSACSGPYSSVAGGLPSPPSTLSESFRSTRNGCQAESVPGWRKLALEHTHSTASHATTEYTAVGLSRQDLLQSGGKRVMFSLQTAVTTNSFAAIRRRQVVSRLHSLEGNKLSAGEIGGKVVDAGL